MLNKVSCVKHTIAVKYYIPVNFFGEITQIFKTNI